jgi:hypothetical protein
VGRLPERGGARDERMKGRKLRPLHPPHVGACGGQRRGGSWQVSKAERHKNRSGVDGVTRASWRKLAASAAPHRELARAGCARG